MFVNGWAIFLLGIPIDQEKREGRHLIDEWKRVFRAKRSVGENDMKRRKRHGAYRLLLALIYINMPIHYIHKLVIVVAVRIRVLSHTFKRRCFSAGRMY